MSDFLVVYPLNDLLKAHSASASKKNTFFYVFKDFDPLRLNKVCHFGIVREFSEM